MNTTVFILCMLAALLELDTTYAFQMLLSRPIVAGPIFGLVTGDVMAGVQVGISAFSAPFLNTAFFVPCLILFFWKSDYIQSIAAGANTLSMANKSKQIEVTLVTSYVYIFYIANNSQFLILSSHMATAAAAATFSESIPCAMGILTIRSHRTIVSESSPLSSVPRKIAILSV